MVLLDLLQSEQRKICKETGTILVSGNDGTIYQLDRDGSILKTIELSEYITVLSLNVQQDIVFLKGWEDTKVFKYENNSVVTLLDLSLWQPRGLYHTVNGNLLISMCSLSDVQSRVVRFSGSTVIQVIENDKQGKPLVSVHSDAVLHLTEYGNGDICVADCPGRAVVVVDSTGDLRFKYRGKITTPLKRKLFEPSKIVNEKNFLYSSMTHQTTLSIL